MYFLVHVQGVEWSNKEGQCETCLSHSDFSLERDYCKWGSSLESSQGVVLGSGKEKTLSLGLLGIRTFLLKIRWQEEAGAEGATAVIVQSQEDVQRLEEMPMGRRQGGQGTHLTMSSAPSAPCRSQSSHHAAGCHCTRLRALERQSRMVRPRRKRTRYSAFWWPRRQANSKKLA